MDSIQELLRRYANITPPNEAVRQAVCAAVRQQCGITIEKKDITYRSGNIITHVGPSARSAILINKQAVLESLNPAIRKQIKDIR